MELKKNWMLNAWWWSNIFAFEHTQIVRTNTQSKGKQTKFLDKYLFFQSGCLLKINVILNYPFSLFFALYPNDCPPLTHSLPFPNSQLTSSYADRTQLQTNSSWHRDLCVTNRCTGDLDALGRKKYRTLIKKCMDVYYNICSFCLKC